MVAESSVLRGRRRGNLVIFGSDQPLPEAALARAAAGDPFPARLVAGRGPAAIHFRRACGH